MTTDQLHDLVRALPPQQRLLFALRVYLSVLANTDPNPNPDLNGAHDEQEPPCSP